ncbi:MAG TPA: hypothetical protein VIW07_05730 [Candidatus Udaeobacter sp.]|jgi:hypothetical protein
MVQSLFIDQSKKAQTKNVHFAVVLEDDPGRDIGMMQYIAHRFFYSANEVEPV